jgi:hypothetical protein
LKRKRVLITTFGFDEGKILSAMRMLAYDKLVLITGEDALEKDGYKRLQEIESQSPDGMETVTVDVFNFRDCLEKIRKVIRAYKDKPWDVMLNVSGGTKVLSDAALFAGFEEGVKSFHCEEDCIELPVILDLELRDRLSEMEIEVLMRIERRTDNKDLEDSFTKEGRSLSVVQKAVRRLRDKGLLGVDFKDGGISLFIEESHIGFKELLVG